MEICQFLRPLAGLLLLLPVTQAQTLDSVPFPLQAQVNTTVGGTLELNPIDGAFQDLLGRSLLTMESVALPGMNAVDLHLTRSNFDFSEVGVHVDGLPEAWDSGDMSLWKGSVQGDPDSDVFLGFSSWGSYGWIRTKGEYFHLLAMPGAGSNWSQARARWVPDQVMQGLNVPSLAQCETDTSSQAGGVPNLVAAPVNAMGVALECKVAIETDFEYTDNFGNLTAAQNFLMMLLGAISDRYSSQIDVVLTYPYVMFYTANNDPWSAHGNGSAGILQEFRSAWQGNIPAGANLAHFVSGAGLGGGIAYLDVLCSQNNGFGVSGGINGGVNFPVAQGSGTWDFVVIAHELGHNFGTGHTHDYCPPIDECASSQFFGSCQNQRNCVSNGTIMSYCHTCSGGMNNITTYFHPQVVTTMRAGALSSCLQPYTGGCTSDSYEPNDSCGAPSPIGVGAHVGLGACSTDSDYYSILVGAGEQVTFDLTFAHAGGDINCKLYASDCFTSLGLGTSSTDNETVSWTNTSGVGETVIFEVYHVGTGNNDYAMDVSLVNTMPCAGMVPDLFEENDSCSAAIAIGDGWSLGLTVFKSDSDFYSLCLPAGQTLDVSAFFVHANADVDIFLYDTAACGGGSGTGLAQGFSSTDDEVLSWTNTSSSNADLVLEVNIYPQSAGDCANYSLLILGSGGQCTGVGNLGSLYCSPASTNSTGFPASIVGTGSALAFDNDLTLTTTQLPVNQFGYYLCSQSPGMISPPGSMGNLCLGGSIGRLQLQVSSSGAGGVIVTPIDLSSMPTNPSQPVLAGQTWNFQLWYRDFVLVTTSNFSDALQIQFQ